MRKEKDMEDQDILLWIVGKSLGLPNLWEFQGVFDMKHKAEAACHGPLYFVAPALLNQALSDESLPEWEGLYWPALAEEQQEV